jgi:small subunit ribosomal protein S4e
MARGPKRHLKRLFAPQDWMLSKLTGVFAPRPRAGAHKARECMPLLIILRNRLKYALNGREAQMILRQKLVKVDGRSRVDPKYPVGFQDVVEIPRTKEQFRALYDVKGRFTLVKVQDAEAKIKLCKVTNVHTTTGRVPIVTTHDGRRLRYASPKILIGDTLVVNIEDQKVQEVIKMRIGKQAIVTGGANRGRIGTILSLERHPGAFDLAHLRDASGTEFVTRKSNIFVIGNSASEVPITLPRLRGVKQNVIEEREQKLIKAESQKQARNSQGAKKRRQH